ncbi:MAG: shikimate dehydrogenase [Prevotellaceae bacterium]|jgi:shikimate dehydrogenase|nr:shikimate dehydrogenase [Prevotellaceae bacterium]
MQNFALIGFPLIQSMSKEFFDDFFVKNNIDAQYQNIEIEDISNFSKIISENKFSGFNVTIPYKEKILPFLDKLDISAKNVGAVNCILVKNKKLIGYNTDIYGFEKAFLPYCHSREGGNLLQIKAIAVRALHIFGTDCKSAPANPQPLEENTQALILGTGGAAKAVKFALEKVGVSANFVSRKKSENVFCYEQLDKQIIENHKLIINATPVGALPNVENCPNIPYQFLTKEHFLFDLICKPNKTFFLQRGENQGAKTENGLQMFYHQAVKSFEIWLPRVIPAPAGIPFVQ